MRPRIYITQPIAPSAIERLRNLGDVELNPDPLHIPTEAELIAAVKRCDILFCLLHDRITAAVIRANPNLRAIATMTITPANIDVAAATERGIPVTTIPSVLLDDATADLAWALLMAVARRVAEADRKAREGIVPGAQSLYYTAADVSGRTLGILGAGGVGKEMARRALGFKMPVLYHDPRRLTPEQECELNCTWASFEEVLRRSDFVSLHVALTEKTRHLIDARALSLMPAHAFLINASRGPVVDEAALIQALERKTIAGAGLDVFETEPDIDPRLLALPNVVVTAHMGSATVRLRAAMADVVANNVAAIVAGRQPPNCWNAAIYGAAGQERV
jgi:glyoxylate reductase